MICAASCDMISSASCQLNSTSIPIVKFPSFSFCVNPHFQSHCSFDKKTSSEVISFTFRIDSNRMSNGLFNIFITCCLLPPFLYFYFTRWKRAVFAVLNFALSVICICEKVAYTFRCFIHVLPVPFLPVLSE